MLTTTTASITYEGNGVTTDFDYPFKIWEAADLEAWLTSPAGNDVQLSNFVVLGIGNPSGGTATVLDPDTGLPIETGYKLTLRRRISILQDFFDAVNNQAFHAEVLEDAIDRVVGLLQQLKGDSDRSFRAAISADVDPELPAAQPGAVLGWNAGGDALVNIAVPGAVIEPGSIATSSLADTAVTTPKIANAAITDAKMASSAITETKIADGAVSFPKLAPMAGRAFISVSPNDAAPGVLNGKLIAGHRVVLTENNDGMAESLTVATPAFKGALINLVGNQTISNDTLTDLLFSGESYDTDQFHYVYQERLTIPSGVSKVRLSGKVGWAANNSGHRAVGIHKNGGIGYQGYANAIQAINSGTIVTWMYVQSPILYVVPGDYFTLNVYQFSGTALNALGTSNGSYSWFAVEVIE